MPVSRIFRIINSPPPQKPKQLLLKALPAIIPFLFDPSCQSLSLLRRWGAAQWESNWYLMGNDGALKIFLVISSFPS